MQPLKIHRGGAKVLPESSGYVENDRKVDRAYQCCGALRTWPPLEQSMRENKFVMFKQKVHYGVPKVCSGNTIYKDRKVERAFQC